MTVEEPMIPVSVTGKPAWEIATLFPLQGTWSAEDYLALDTNRLIELDKGRLEVLAVPTELHQIIVAFLYRTLFQWSQSVGAGRVLMAPMRVQMANGKFREPDVLFMASEHANRRHSKFWEGADFVIEVVSEDDPDRDLVAKRREYAEAGIPEYWIVDPRDESILVLVLDGKTAPYTEHARCCGDDVARSVTLPGLEVVTKQAFDETS